MTIRERVLERFFRSRVVADHLDEAARRATPTPEHDPASWPPYRPDPYAAPGTSGRGAESRPAIFITGRFRSGSTLLWNMFNKLGPFTAYYEPLNERQWFLMQDRRVDPTHIGVDDYHANYDGMKDLAALFDRTWIRQRLYMNRMATDWNMLAYIDALVERAARMPVLQFNRVDFRLEWLKAHYPKARILHIYRSPRDQWISSLHGAALFKDVTVAAFRNHDRFYLRAWSENLQNVFPFLKVPPDESPYVPFYLLWRMSYLFGTHYADASVAFEDLAGDPRGRLEDALGRMDVEREDIDWSAIDGLVAPVKQGKWRQFADEDWFAAKEAQCERVLRGTFGPPDTGAGATP
ncbi:MAG: sulfotransferase family protein [Rhodospirillaceae bacterium]|nr:sulfotransferase family protein [Rhodospirillaceae bacterium]